MKHWIRAALLGAILLTGASFAGGSLFAAQVSVGITIGAPPAPKVIRTRPRSPGPDFVWVDGYWYAVGRKWVWHQGYWTRPPYPGAVWVVPRYEGGRFFDGYWEGPRGRVEHDHKWDRDHDRDFRH